MPMKRETLKRLSLMIGLFLLGGWLLMDATTQVLYARDPVSGRARGCYTDVEIFLGLKSRSDWIRITELVGGSTLGIAAIVVLIKWPESK